MSHYQAMFNAYTKRKSYELTLPELPLKQFSYHKDQRLLTCEASSLPGFKLCRLFSDACDEGIAIRSHHTGRVVTFALSKVDKDREGDVAGWRFTPVRATPGVREVLVIND